MAFLPHFRSTCVHRGTRVVVFDGPYQLNGRPTTQMHTQTRTPGRLDHPRSATLRTLGILDGAGHNPPAECPAILVPVVTSFLAEHVDA